MLGKFDLVDTIMMRGLMPCTRSPGVLGFLNGGHDLLYLLVTMASQRARSAIFYTRARTKANKVAFQIKTVHTYYAICA